MKDHHQTTRRQMLKESALGLGLLAAACPVCEAMQRGRGQGMAQGRGNQQPVYQLGHGETRTSLGRGGRHGRGEPLQLRSTNPAVQVHIDRCKHCGDCSGFCRDVTGVSTRRVPPGEDACIHCGQCTFVCRGDLVTEQYHYPLVDSALKRSDRIVIASTSPAIRVALGEMFRMAVGTNVEGRTVTALKRRGFDYVLDTSFGADVTVMEEASELLARIEAKERLPLMTSCCPAWVRFAKLFYPDLVPHLSTVKSPVMIQGAMVKSYFAEKNGIDPAAIYHVALAPCTAKKAEILLPDMNAAGTLQSRPEQRDVDAVLTCRETGYLLGDAGIDLATLREDTPYDPLLGRGSGAGMIFGNTGGVTEAAMRTAYQLLNGENPPKTLYEPRPVRGLDTVRQATIDLGKIKLKAAIVHGIAGAIPLIDAIQKGDAAFDFVEVMACPGGCIGGGGQPRSSLPETQRKAQRLNALYKRDLQDELRLSHENPDVKAIYDAFLGRPLGERSQQMLHVAKR